MLSVSLKHKRDGSFLEKRCGENLQNCVKRVLETELFFENGDEQIDGHGYPDLNLHAVGRSPKETLDAQVLLDPFEKKLDLPSATISFGNTQRRQKEIIGEKDESFVDVLGVIADAAKWSRITLRSERPR